MSDSIARYSFLSWARRGIGARIRDTDTLGAPAPAKPVRATVPITIEVNHTSTFDKTIALHGPGDVVGLEPRAIVRTDPRANITDFEPNYLASIELYDEDLPWRYTPASANGHRLRPWLALVVLADGEFERAGDSIRVADAAGLFHPAAQTWAWVHVHVNTDLSGPDALDAAVTANPDVALSRIVSPRRLAPNTPYTAFLVPTFESGRLAGLGLDPPADLDGAKAAWGSGQDQFPIYYQWSFRTGAAGDFESLVRLLEPRVLDARVGIRDLDVRDPAPGLIGGIAAPPVLGLEGALRSPQTTSTVWPSATETFPARLAALVNASIATGADPVVAPPFYGQWHAATPRMAELANPPWIDELNRDPRHRSAAGFGSEVIRRLQDELAASAWRQLGAADAANRLLVVAQLARFTATSIYARHLVGLDDDRLFSITAPAHARVLAGATTVRHAIVQSIVPTAVLDRGFRRVARMRGPLARRLYGAPRPTQRLAQLNASKVTAAPPVPDPTHALVLDAARGPISTTTSAIHKIPGRAGFEVTKPGAAIVPARTGADSAQARRFRTALLALHAELEKAPTVKPAPPALAMQTVRSSLADAIEPSRSIPKRVLARVRGDLGARVDPLDTVMWGPQFDQPMYAPLADISSELLLPNVGLITQNTISLLQTNNRFVESYLVGLNHEMARELLWREYPTDQRGTYFRRFWDFRDAAGLAPPDVDAIDQWPRTSELGSHARFGDDRAVLVIRGDLLKKYPTAVIYAVEARWPAGTGKRELGTGEKYPLFRASIDPDLTFLGFDLDVATAHGSQVRADNKPGWFFVIKQRPGEPRFGLDVTASTSPTATWDDLAWSNVDAGAWIDVDHALRDVAIGDAARWGQTSADMASILYQDPVLIAVHATEMLR